MSQTSCTCAANPAPRPNPSPTRTPSSTASTPPIPTRCPTAALIAASARGRTRPCCRWGGAHAMRGCIPIAGRHGAQPRRVEAIAMLTEGGRHEAGRRRPVRPTPRWPRTERDTRRTPSRPSTRKRTPTRPGAHRQMDTQPTPDCAPWPSRFAQRRPGRSGGRAAGGVVGTRNPVGRFICVRCCPWTAV